MNRIDINIMAGIRIESQPTIPGSGDGSGNRG